MAPQANEPAPPMLTMVVPGNPLTHVRQLALGYGFSCALLEDATVRCWGRNDHGQRGVGAGAEPAVPTMIPGLVDVAEIDVAYSTGCARGPAGTVRCWGEGYGSKQQPLETVPGLSNATQISVSHYRLHALRADGTVWCWRPGGCAPAVSKIAQRNELLEKVAQVDEHWDHACARLADGTVKCWGAIGYDASSGQASTRSSRDPVLVPGLRDAAEVALGSHHTCVRVLGGRVQCWGLGWHGSLGQGSGASSNTPTEVSNLRDVVQVASGGLHSCALHKAGTVSCWGGLADGSQPSPSSPVAVPGLRDVQQIACGGEHSCALLRDGTVRCWGKNHHGELGTKDAGAASTLPVYVVTP